MSVEPAFENRAEELPFSVQLFEQLGPAVEALDRRRTLQPARGDPDLMRQWFLLVWQSAQASVPLLEWACQRLAQWPQSPFTELLGEYYMLHALEERSHDERLLDDFKVLGVGGDDAFAELPNPHIAAMVGSQYHLIRHYHPALLLGYIAFCAGHPPRREAIQSLRARSAASPGAWPICAFQTEEDPLQIEELRAVLDEVPLDPPLRQAIVGNALRCVASYAAAFDSFFPAEIAVSSSLQRQLVRRTPR